MIKGFLIVIFILLALTSCGTDRAPGSVFTGDIATIDSTTVGRPDALYVKDFEHPTGVFFPPVTSVASVGIFNPTEAEQEAWIQFILRNHSGELIFSQVERSSFSPGETVQVDLRWSLSQDIDSGRYDTELSVWDNTPASPDAALIAQSFSQEPLLFYRFQENFEALDPALWGTSSHRLGRSRLRSANVSTDRTVLKIDLTAGSFDGGEIFTRELQSFGAYEARMKLPNAPSSITGFFLYKAPDYYYEIDIELCNDPQGTLMLTTYAQGEKKNEYVGELGFDPTQDFHTYRIEYYSDRVEFFIDNQYIKGWYDGFPQEEMRLMVNVWYPKWMAGTAASEKQSLLIDWIRY